jgi:hypothetical protein
MKETIHEPTTSRRQFLATAAVAVPAIAAAPLTALANTGADPILELIEAHKSANAEHVATCSHYSDMEQTIDKSRRRGDFTVEGVTVVEGDDPRWTEACRRFQRAVGFEDAIAVEIAATEPTSLAGVSAILKYAVEFVECGHLWPDEYALEGGDECPQEWNHHLHRTLALAVGRLAG